MKVSLQCQSPIALKQQVKAKQNVTPYYKRIQKQKNKIDLKKYELVLREFIIKIYPKVINQQIMNNMKHYFEQVEDFLYAKKSQQLQKKQMRFNQIKKQLQNLIIQYKKQKKQWLSLVIYEQKLNDLIDKNKKDALNQNKQKIKCRNEKVEQYYQIFKQIMSMNTKTKKIIIDFPSKKQYLHIKQIEKNLQINLIQNRNILSHQRRQLTQIRTQNLQMRKQISKIFKNKSQIHIIKQPYTHHNTQIVQSIQLHPPIQDININVNSNTNNINLKIFMTSLLATIIASVMFNAFFNLIY